MSLHSDSESCAHPYTFEQKYYKLLKENKSLRLEKEYFENQLYQKDKFISEIQSQLHHLKRKIHHHKSVWLQIAKDNKLLREELLNSPGINPSLITPLQVSLTSLIEQIFHSDRVNYEQKALMDLIKQHKYFECLSQVVQIFQDYIGESTERSYSCLNPRSGMMGESLEKRISPIYHEAYTDDDEIDKLMDESKLLLQTLEKQNQKLDSLNDKITSDCKSGRIMNREW